MSEEFITFDSSTALNTYLAERAIERMKETQRQIDETWNGIRREDAENGRRECERLYRHSNGIARIGEYDANGKLVRTHSLQTNSLLEYINYMIINEGEYFSYKSSYLAFFSKYEILAGWPKAEMFVYLKQEHIHWLPKNKISDYGTRIALWGDNLKFLNEEQAATLTCPQIQAIYIAKKTGKINERSLKHTPVGKILKENHNALKNYYRELQKENALRARNDNQAPPMEMEGGCCIIE